MITGILPVDKPMGWTSHDVVARLRRTLGQKQVGHAGTLDPLATGVLVVMLGGATRLSAYLMGAPKTYCAEVGLGTSTVTDDAEGPLRQWHDPSGLSRKDVEAGLQRFVGDIEQVPPPYAAIKQDGKKLYQLVRQGLNVEPEPRHVTIHTIDLVRWQPPRVTLRVSCSSGTYIRALARDLGTELGVGGYLHGLRRAASGSIGIARCAPAGTIGERDALLPYLLAPEQAVLDLPAMALDAGEVARVRQGQQLDLPCTEAEDVRVYGPSGTLEALARTDGNRLKPFRVFAGGDMHVAGR